MFLLCEYMFVYNYDFYFISSGKYYKVLNSGVDSSLSEISERQFSSAYKSLSDYFN